MKILKMSEKNHLLAIIGLLAILFVFSIAINDVSAATKYVNNTGSDGNDGSSATPYKTIAKGIIESTTSSNPNDNEVVIAKGEYKGAGNKDITISKNLSIYGERYYAKKNGVAGADSIDPTIINAENSGRMFTIDEGCKVNIYGITFINGYEIDRGGAIYGNTGSQANIINCSFTNCTSNNGGAVYGGGSNWNFVDVGFINCTSNNGGAVQCLYAEGWNFVGVNFTNCKSNGDAGAVYIVDSNNGSFSNVIFANCSSDSSGGVIYSDYSHYWSFSNVSFSNCNSNARGGAIYMEYSNYWNFSNVNFSNSNSNNIGGAICGEGANWSFSNVNFNKCNSNFGGGVYIQGYYWKFSHCNFTNNTAKTKGGAIYMGNYNGTVIDHCNFTGNKVTDATGSFGSAICADFTSNTFFINITNSYFKQNKGAATNNYLDQVYINPIATVNFVNNVNGNMLDVVYVNATGGNNDNDGGSWATAVQTLAYALTILNPNGTVHIANGNYTGISNYNLNLTFNCSFLGESVAGVILDAVEQGRFFNISSGVNVSFANMTFRNGKSSGNGGAIYNEGVLAISDCRFENNTARLGGVIANKGAVINNISYSTLTVNKATNVGGAIFNGTITVKESNFTNNSAASLAGALYLELNSVLNSINCNFINNSGADSASTQNYGGAIALNSRANATIIGTNFTKNYVKGASDMRGGAIWGSGNLFLLNCTFTENSAPFGGAMYITSNNYTNITGCIFIGNTANNTANNAAGGAIYLFSTNGTIIDSEFINNTANKYGGAMIFYFQGDYIINNCNFTNNSAENGGAFADITNPNSLSISNCNFKENNATGLGGAIHLNSTNIKLNLEDSTFDNNQAIDGGAIWSNGTLVVKNSSFTGNNATNGGAISADGVVIIDGSHFVNNNATDSGGAIFSNNASTVMNISKSTFDENNGISKGGAIYHTGTLTVVDSNFTKNIARLGGGICQNAGILNLNGVSFNNNIANRTAPGGNNHGGAILAMAGTINITGSSFINNIATTIIIGPNGSSHGGAIFLNSGNIIVSKSVFENNSAYDYAGAIYFAACTATIIDSNFTGNTGNMGGAFFVNGPINVSFINSSFKDNVAGRGNGDGGVLYSFNSYLSFKECNFSNNKADREGGAIAHYYGNLTVDNCNFTDNSASANGGAIYRAGAGNLKTNISNCNFVSNNATVDGGALFVDDNVANVSVSNCSFVSNKAVQNGGGIFVIDRTNITIANSQFNNNQAVLGGAIFSNSSLIVNNSSFVGNNASSGGAIYADSNSKLNITSSNFSKNIASANGGAIFAGGDGKLDVVSSDFVSNIGNSGGAIYITDNSDAVLNYNRFNGNDKNNTGSYTVYSGSSGIIDANLNWWSSNNASSKVNSGITLNSWYVMILNTSVDISNIKAGDIIAYNYYFLLNNSGSLVDDPNRVKLPEFNVTLNYNNDSKTEVLDGKIDHVGLTVIALEVSNIIKAYDIDDYVTNLTFSAKCFVNITVSNVTGDYNKITNLTATVVNNITGTPVDDVVIDFYVNGSKVGSVTTDINGIAKFGYNGTVVGNFTWYAVFDGDADYFAFNSTNATLTINKLPTVIVVNNTNVDYGKNATLFVNLTDANGNALVNKNVTLYINGESYTVTTDSNGIASLDYGFNLTAGSYSWNASFAGDENYTGIDSVNANLIISKLDTVIVVDSVNIVYGNNGVLKVILKDTNGKVLNKKVQLFLNGKNIANITTVNGVATFNYGKSLGAGNYAIVASFAGDENYTKSNATGTLIVKKLATKITSLTTKSTGIYNEYTNIKATLKDINGKLLANKKVSLTINKKTYTTNTDKRGIANFNIKKLKGGKYTVKALFKGDANYSGSTISKVQTVKSKIDLAIVKIEKVKYTRNKQLAVYKIAIQNRGNVKSKVANLKIWHDRNGYKTKVMLVKINPIAAGGKLTLVVKYYPDKDYHKYCQKKYFVLNSKTTII